MSNPAKNILIMAAGTGGHIFPALAVAQELQRQGMNVFWLGTPNGMEQRIIGATDFPIYTIDIAGIRKNGLKRLLKAPLQIIQAIVSSMQIMKSLHIDMVVGFGGYVAGPGGIAAFLQGIPLVIQEQNAVAGFTNKLLAKLAYRICEGFPNTFMAKTPSQVLYTGNPIRAEMTQQPTPKERYAEREGAFVIQVIGGSLGAKALNEMLPKAFAQIKQPLIIRHQCGQNHADATQTMYDKYLATQDLSTQDLSTQNVSQELNHHQVTVQPFIDNMAQAYLQADLVICRAGASTISELSAMGVPSILIPLPSAVDDHQTANAKYLSNADAAVLMPQASMTADSLAMAIEPLLDRNTLVNMANKAYRLGQRHATQTVAKVVLSKLAQG